MIRLSLTMIVKNEERCLRNCLESVKGVVDEIILVDTGSTDKTLEIAAEYNARIYTFEWINDFAAARNFALTKAEGKWILYLDADETLDSSGKKELEKIVKGDEQAACFCTVKSIDNEFNRDNSMRYVRLFRNIPGINFEGKVHEQISASLKNNGAKFVNTGIIINHFGYNISGEEKRKKGERNLSLLLSEYETSPTGYNAYQLANTYNTLNDAVNSTKYFQIAAEDHKLSSSITAECYANLAIFSLKELNGIKAAEYINKSLAKNREQAFTNFLAARISLFNGDLKKCEEYCRKALAQNNRAAKNSSMSDIVIYMDNIEIITFGLQTALKSGSRSEFSFYLTQYQTELKKKNHPAAGGIHSLVTKFLSKQKFNKSDEESILSLLNRNSSDLFYQLIENSIQSLSTEFFSRLYKEHFPDEQAIRLTAMNYTEKNDLNSAILLLEENVNYIKYNPSIVLYLVSCYMSLNEVEKALKWLNFAENEFKNLPGLIPVFKSIKEKISC